MNYEEDRAVFARKFESLEKLLHNSTRIGVLTGAGVSTMSGIPDFRGTGGVYTKKWNHLDVEEIISIDFFRKDPKVFYEWAADVWYKLENYEPNIVHKTLAKMEGKGLLQEVFTQNIDLLHQRAGSSAVFELHGSPYTNSCTKCGAQYSYDEVKGAASKGEIPFCPECGGVIKPDIVFYGENLDPVMLDRAEDVFGRECDLCIVLGSSLNVSPANMLPYLAARRGCPFVLVNASSTPLDSMASLRFSDLRQFCEAVEKYLDKI